MNSTTVARPELSQCEYESAGEPECEAEGCRLCAPVCVSLCACVCVTQREGEAV